MPSTMSVVSVDVISIFEVRHENRDPARVDVLTVAPMVAVYLLDTVYYR